MRYQSTIFSTILVFFVAQAYSDELMCYICDDCVKVNDDTPLLPCDASFFNQGDTTEASTLTTNPASTTTDEISTEEISTTTTTTDMTTSELSTETTDAPTPTPPTVGPVETTTSVPTPPNIDIVLKNTEVNEQSKTMVNNTDIDSDTTSTRPTDAEAIQNTNVKSDTNLTINSATNSKTNSTTNSETKVGKDSDTTKLDLLSRRRRAISDVSYHCYSVQKKNETGSLTTLRGCSRVTTMESVCNVLNTQNPDVELSDCNPCSMSKCNGSSALRVSLLTIVVALLAGFLRGN